MTPMWNTGGELESQDTYPAVGASWSRFFRNQEHLTRVQDDKRTC